MKGGRRRRRGREISPISSPNLSSSLILSVSSSSSFSSSLFPHPYPTLPLFLPHPYPLLPSFPPPPLLHSFLYSLHLFFIPSFIPSSSFISSSSSSSYSPSSSSTSSSFLPSFLGFLRLMLTQVLDLCVCASQVLLILVLSGLLFFHAHTSTFAVRMAAYIRNKCARRHTKRSQSFVSLSLASFTSSRVCLLHMGSLVCLLLLHIHKRSTYISFINFSG